MRYTSEKQVGEVLAEIKRLHDLYKSSADPVDNPHAEGRVEAYVDCRHLMIMMLEFDGPPEVDEPVDSEPDDAEYMANSLGI